MPRQMPFRHALRAAMIDEMERDPDVFLLGEEVGYYQGAYKVTEGMLEQFGPRRVIDTPIAESGFAGIAIGAAITGLRPIVEFMTWNFSAVAFDQILNNAAKLRQMSGGQLKVPIVFRAPNGSAKQVGSQHSHAMEHFYAHVPGLKCIAPATCEDAYGMLKAAIRDDNPVLVFESETLYGLKGEIPDGNDFLVPLGKARTAREGKDVSLIAWSRMVHIALEAAEQLEKQGVSAEVIDLRSLRPLDDEALIASVTRTHHAVVVHEGWPYGGVGAEVVDRIQRLCFDELDAPVGRVTFLDVPMPYNAALEQLVIPSTARVVEAARAAVYARLSPPERRSMAKVLDMPKLSPTMEEGQLSIWHKNEGDEIAIDDLLAEVETDKATMEFRSFDKGVLLKVLVPAGSTVKLGQPVAVMGARGEDISALLSTLGTADAAPPPAAAAPAPAAAPPAAPASAPAAAPPAAAAPRPASPAEPGRIKASPYVRKLAREQDLDLTGVEGSGPHGRIIARDLETAATAAAGRPQPEQAQAAPHAPAPAGTAARAAPVLKPLSMMRKTIARRLTESKREVPHFYLTIDVDAEALSALRETVNGELRAAAGEGETPEKISINDLLIRACAVALRKVPECNASFAGDAIAYHQRVDISVAVSVPDGLLTPVVRDADQKGVLGIARSVRELAGRAKAKKLQPDEMSDGTFSISNLGMFGIDSFSAVINPPEGAILAVGKVRDEPVVKSGEVVPGKRLALTLSCDHRVIDGALGARFLAELRSLLERPMQLLLV
jgi:pyruvate dehydrogenase E2 component (dihydrolipoamide acetyltransferase)